MTTVFEVIVPAVIIAVILWFAENPVRRRIVKHFDKLTDTGAAEDEMCSECGKPTKKKVCLRCGGSGWLNSQITDTAHGYQCPDCVGIGCFWLCSPECPFENYT